MRSVDIVYLCSVAGPSEGCAFIPLALAAVAAPGAPLDGLWGAVRVLSPATGDWAV